MTIFLLLSLVLVLSTESVAPPGGRRSPTESYDKLLLVLQWPTSYCNTNSWKIRCNHPIPPEFTIHGLWPNKNSGRSFKCRAPDPSIKNLYRQISSDLHKKLKQDWPNLNSLTPPEYLWEHEYETHGHCFRGFSNPVDYFQTALGIATRVRNIMPNMRLSSGQTITRGQLYHVEDFRHVTIAGGILILGLRCNYARNSAIPQLLEIVFCTDRNGNLKDCTYFVDKCNNKWRDRNGVVRSGWFQFPDVSSSSRSPPDWDSVQFFLLFYFYLFFILNS